MIQRDLFQLRAAQGWILLNNLREARAEVDQISRHYPDHFEYLQVWCRILISDRSWSAALHLAKRQLTLAPHQPEGWINRAFCLHELQRTGEARRSLLPAGRKFPKHDLIAFNLACYCCHLGRYEEALVWVNRAIQRCTGLLGVEQAERMRRGG